MTSCDLYFGVYIPLPSINYFVILTISSHLFIISDVGLSSLFILCSLDIEITEGNLFDH